MRKLRMLEDHLKALDLARDGYWDEAHRLIQSYSDELACLIHGYLHRQEGDLGNAGYWYRRTGIEIPDNTLEEELDRLCALARAGH
ncbi:MAG: hypothetical protein WB783_10805 [Arenicellales bacterium]